MKPYIILATTNNGAYAFSGSGSLDKIAVAAQERSSEYPRTFYTVVEMQEDGLAPEADAVPVCIFYMGQKFVTDGGAA